jgi:hypothetical protein
MNTILLAAIASFRTTVHTAVSSPLIPLQMITPAREADEILQRIDVAELDDDTCIERFRFTLDEIRYIIQCMQLPSSILCPNRIRCDMLTAMCILLRRLSFPSRLKDLKNEFGIPKSTLSTVLSSIVSLLIQRYNSFIELWPGINQRRVRVWSEYISHRYHGVHHVWAL